MRSLLIILVFSLLGIWKSGDVTYTFYSDHTGVVWDSIEGDTITKWYVSSSGNLVLEDHLLWNDTDSFKFYPLSKDKFKLDNYIFERKKK